MGISQSINRINFEKTQNIIKQSNNINFIIINTLNHNNQKCLIKNTILAENEETTINYYLKNNKNINILIYGENCCDKKLIEKVNQLKQLGFNNLYIYIGGLFEWLLLQDIYGEEEFPTTEKCLDILKYKG
jgi:23S rRNA pseudoU1915 N3-methylase RlmH|tara:strand:+ start:115 stop:507 length:393 start_codon:yes stop_codon:yes gene_type:complete